MTRKEINRLIFENSQYLEPNMNLRGVRKDPYKLPDMTPNTQPMPEVLDATANVSPRARLYRKMGEGPSTIEALTGGGRLPVPNTPIRHKAVNSRSFLRGLVGGLNNAAGMRGDQRDREIKQLGMEERFSSDGAGSPAGLDKSGLIAAQTRAWDALAGQRTARADEIGEPDPADPLYDAKKAAWEALAWRRRQLPAPGAGGAPRTKSGLTPSQANTEAWRKPGLLMKPWEVQVQKMMESKPIAKRNINGAKISTAEMGVPLGQRSSPEVQKWLDGIRRTYAQKLGIDLSLGQPEFVQSTTAETGDPYSDFLNETDEN